MSAAHAVGERARRLATAWVLALVFCGAAVALSGFGYDRLPRPRPLEELAYFPSGEKLRPMALGHAESMADLAWIQAVQYYGAHRAGDNQFARMGHLFDVLTTLSPHFVPAYVFGAFALAQEGFDFAAAERLMQKGVDLNPDDGWLAFEMGFLYYVRPGQRDLLSAAQYFEQAARKPGAPIEALRFAAFARQRAGDARVAYELWRELAVRTPNPYLQRIAEREMARIQEAWRRGQSGPAAAPLPQTGVQLRKAQESPGGGR